MGAGVAPAAMPITTTRPPSRAILKAAVTVSGRPSASKATSTPSPPVSRRTSATASPALASTPSVAPSWRAASSFSARTSTAMTRSAPKSRASWITFDPTPPAPTTATVSAARSAAWCFTAPYAVMIAQPRMQASSSGSASGTRKTSVAGTTQYSARPPMLYMARTVPSARRRRLSPS